MLLFPCVFSLFVLSNEPIPFTHIGLNEGLSQSTVVAIEQDRLGRLWLATNDGLNCYDGYSFEVYRHIAGDSTTIAHDIIRTLCVDNKGNLWVGTDGGLSLYDMERQHFQNFAKERTAKRVSHIVELSEGQLLVNIQGRLAQFDVCAGHFVKPDLPEELMKESITVLKRNDKNLFIGTYGDVYVYSFSSKKLQKFKVCNASGRLIHSILQQSPACLWIATEGEGLYRLNPQTGENRQYLYTVGGKISSDFVRSLALDAQGHLWVGTFDGLNIYDEKADTFTVYKTKKWEEKSLSQNSVRCIFKDSQNGMWLGTYFGGLNYYHSLRDNFKTIRFVPGQQFLGYNVIGCIVEDGEELWVGTNKGLNCYNVRQKKHIWYTQKDGLQSEDIKAVHVDKKTGKVYIGTQAGGLSVFDRNTKRIKTFNDKRTSVRSRCIYTILPTTDGKRLWLGTLDNLQLFDIRSSEFSVVDKDWKGEPLNFSSASVLFQDSKHRLWVGSDDGLNVYRQREYSLEAVSLFPEGHILSKKYIFCIHESEQGIFWIGTRDGLFRFDEQKKEISEYTMNNGLPNNVVYGILEDSHHHLWLSTNAGLCHFLPEKMLFRTFTTIDGLSCNQFSPFSYCRTSSGQMFFGSIDGITCFYPEYLTDNPYAPKVQISTLRVFNKQILPGDETEILKKNICMTRNIVLNAAQSVFSLEFVTPNYVSGGHNMFAYKLVGYDRDWFYTDSHRVASYSNLPAGKYRFLVKAANNVGKWNEAPTELEITVLPIWYKTWWAYMLWLGIFIGSIVLIIRFIWIKKTMNVRLELERVDKERQKELNEMKLRFFINISHELRTPLTLILAPLSEMQAKLSGNWVQKQLGYIQKNTERLLHLVNQLMDYRRAELGVFKLQVGYCRIHDIIEKNYLFYKKLAQQKKIHYEFCSEVEGKEILCDSEYLELIVNNLLSNAFKYTPREKSITVALREEGFYLLLQVKDTGEGIPMDKQTKIFERFYQADNKFIGSGVGLSLVQRLVELHHGHVELKSTEGLGSIFSIYLPTDENVYTEEEKRTENSLEESNFSTNRREMYLVDTDIDVEDELKNSEEIPVGIEVEEEKESTDKEKCVLIVEDNQEILNYLTEELELRYRVLNAGNGKEALEIMKEQQVDLVLTDVMMPVMDGLQLCKRIKQNICTCHIPVLILSAKSDLKEQLDGLQLGADDYIPKPFSLMIVMAKIKNIFRIRHNIIEHYSQSQEIEPEQLSINPLDEKFLKKAIEVVEEHLDNYEFTIDDFAREMFMSRSNLHLKMKALTGGATSDFIRKIRFNKACSLLKEERYSVAEISMMVGFNTPSYFTTSFKKHFGCLPSEYVKKAKESTKNL